MRRLISLVTAGLAVVALAGCGGNGSSRDPQALLRETFTGTHAVNSGDLSVSVSLQHSGGVPLTITLTGPFQRHGASTLPSADFTVSAGEAGIGVTLGVISTPDAGYVRFEGADYRLPAGDFRRLAASFGSVAGGSGALLGLHPLSWLTDPNDAGAQTIGGVQTEHITAGVDVATLLTDLGPLISKASALGVLGSSGSSGSPGLSAAERQRLTTQIHAPRVEIWTGSTDHTIRRLRLAATVPVPGQLASLLSGATTARAVVTASYTQLNQPQTVTAPTHLQPYANFQREIGAVLSQFGG